ncbi:MAG: hypothetical protein KME30_02515 [Iphinoe sp. HA4291-MV1]|jgi:hypothetical protein|nr:hypothetical protein [Iphinoe sp. HA4291-MV1]
MRILQQNDQLNSSFLMSGKIQTFTAEHLDKCANLYVEVFNGEPWNEQWTIETARLRLLEILRALLTVR